jgi:hypothetical protein
MEMICASFGAQLQDVGFPPDLAKGTDFLEHAVSLVIRAIDEALVIEEKQWVFVFDQVNKIFARYRDKCDIETVPFPFFYYASRPPSKAYPFNHFGVREQ